VLHFTDKHSGKVIKLGMDFVLQTTSQEILERIQNQDRQSILTALELIKPLSFLYIKNTKMDKNLVKRCIQNVLISKSN